ncbi:MAG: hypothetical protein WC327_03135 [Candidatus Cloacimonadia bacterium]
MIAVMIDHKLSRYTEIIQYTFKFIFDTLGYSFRFIEKMNELKGHDILFCYSLLEPTVDEIHEFATNRLVFFAQAEIDLLVPDKLNSDDFHNYLQELRLFTPTPVICKKKIETPILMRSIGNIFWGEFKFDVIGNTFFHLSGYENLLSQRLDQKNGQNSCSSQLTRYSNFPYLNSLLWVVDSFLKEAINNTPITFLLKKEYWPNGEDYAYAVSHNIDSLHKWPMKRLLATTFTDLFLLLSFKWGFFFRSFKEKLIFIFTNNEVYWKFYDIAEKLDDFKVKSTFFLGNEKSEGVTGKIDYSLKDADLVDELNTLTGKGNELGFLLNTLASSGKEISSSLNQFSASLYKKIRGIRYNFGQRISSIDAASLDEAEPLYNSSKSLGKHCGFFNGLAYPYREYVANRSAKYIELPVVFSDDMLQIDTYKIYSKDKAMEMIKNTFLNIQKTNGLLTYNFSMSKLADIPYNMQLFEFTLKILSQGNGFKGTLSEIAEWWIAREEVRIEERIDEIVIHFTKPVDQITFTLYGNRMLKKIINGKGTINGNVLKLESVKEGDSIRIIAPLDEQIYLDMEREAAKDDIES